ncbi:MAG: peptidoglycan-binding protein [Saprospirales bacterium]|nr:peptidoglycan-binding protein [Saprospirales bacterium]
MPFQKMLLDQVNIGESLKRGSDRKDLIKALQTSLHELGFGEELNWAKYGADGDFGNSTVAALKAFALKNGINSDGESVSQELASKIMERLEIVRALKVLKELTHKGPSDQILFRGSVHRDGVSAFQKILHRLDLGAPHNPDEEGNFGNNTVEALKTFAAREGLQSDGARVTSDLVKRILDKFTPFLGSAWAQEKPSSPPPAMGPVSSVFKKFKKGVYTVGKHRPADFIEKNPDLLKTVGLTDSIMRIIAAVSQNEGNLDAINTWDDSFLTFGMFQWTIGQGPGKGELPAMLSKVKQVDPALFHKYFGQYNLDISAAHANDKVYGYFTLDGKLVDQPARKELLRADQWATRFWESGKDPFVQAVQVEHAASRLLSFYWKPGKAPIMNSLSDLVTSEYGVALLLDNHVNRPGYVRECVDRAMTQTGLKDPLNWTTVEEQKLLLAYLDIRKLHGKYPMTHAKERGDRMAALVASGKLSKERNSFLYEAIQSRDLGIRVPMGYRHGDYPEIEWEEKEEKDLQP